MSAKRIGTSGVADDSRKVERDPGGSLRPEPPQPTIPLRSRRGNATRERPAGGRAAAADAAIRREIPVGGGSRSVEAA
jgi:hypothetical protein